MKFSILYILLFTAVSAISQKVVLKSEAFPPGFLLQVDASRCYSLKISTVSSSFLQVVAKANGEYADHMGLQLVKEGTTLRLTPGLPPFMDRPDDKLGAHKVVSISLEIKVPEGRKVEVFADQAAIAASGSYEDLRINLDAGECRLIAVQGYAGVATRLANIRVESAAAQIEAKSQFGTLSPNPIPFGNDTYHLSSISGDIHLVKRE